MSEESKKGLSRRKFVALTGGALVASGLLAACGDAATTVPVAATTSAATSATTAAGAATTAAGAATTAAAGATTAAAGATTAAVGAATTAAAPAPTATLQPPVAQPAGSLKITFWHGLGGNNGVILQQVVNKYNSSQQKYYVETSFNNNYEDTIQKLNTSLAGGALPNVAQIYDLGTQRMIDTKKITPVQDMIEKDKSDILKDLEPNVAAYYTVNGKLYSMPFNSSAPVMYFDKKAFKEVGLDTEKKIWTYDEVLAAATKLTKKDASGKITRAGVEFSMYGWIFEQEIAIQNALFAEPDNGRKSTRASKLVFNGEAGQNWLNFLKKLQDAGVARNLGRASGSTASTTQIANMSRGESAITFESIAILRGMINAANNTGLAEIGVAYLPRPAGATGGVIQGGASLWMPVTGTAEQQAAAWDFVKYMGSPETQSFFSSGTGYYPTRLSAYNQPEVKEALSKYPQFQIAVDQLRASPAGVPTSGGLFGTFSGTRLSVEAGMEQFLTGKVATSKAALDAAAKTENEKLTEYNSTIK